jgi:dihydropyrimidinase
MQAYDCVIRGGTVVTDAVTVRADVAIRGECIAAIGVDLPPGNEEIDARGKLVMPGGVDAHAHIEQFSSNGIQTSDDWESATRSAAFGGTTTVIAFAAQHLGMNLAEVVDDYADKARKGALVDYAFHMIVADPTEVTLREHIPALIEAGLSTIKVFMTYDRVRLHDEQLLDLMAVAREKGALVCVHAENHGMLSWMGKRLVERGYKAPKFHAASHPRAAEVEAIHRVIAMAEFLDQPLMVFHVSTREGAAVVREARGRGVKVFAETCPQYLFLTREDLDRPGLEGAKWMCSPPLRDADDQEALWRSLALGDLQLVSSDHAPYAYDETGKLKAGPEATFKQIANGLPGLEARLPLLFDAMVSKGRLGPEKFVELTCAAPARIYNLYPRKGCIAVGADADIVIWDPERRVRLDDALMHDSTGFTPYAGREVQGWPDIVLRRGRILVQGGALRAEPGSGRFLPRSGGEAARPLGRSAQEMDPARNGGAALL